MKYVIPLDETEKRTLREAYQNHPKHRVRQRALALLMSNLGSTRAQVAETIEVERDTVSRWFKAWESKGICMLFDQHRSGRPRILDEKDQDKLAELAQQHPHQSQTLLARLIEEQGKELSHSTLIRALKKTQFSL